MAKIDTSKITGYAEMSAEDKLKALEAFEYEDNAAELEKQKAAVSKANSEAAEWKRKHNALLGEDEKKKQEQEEKFANMEKELSELREAKRVSEFKAKFIAQGYDEALAEDTAKAMADGDSAKVFANQQKFLDEYAKQSALASWSRWLPTMAARPTRTWVWASAASTAAIPAVSSSATTLAWTTSAALPTVFPSPAWPPHRQLLKLPERSN